MSAIATEIRPKAPEVPSVEGLISIESEQQVLGCAIMYPEAFRTTEAFGGAVLFADPVHADIYKIVAQKSAKGDLISPVTVADAFRGGDRLEPLGGASYLARLAGAALPPSLTKGYAKFLGELARRRSMNGLLETARESLLRAGKDETVDDIAARLEASLMAISQASSVKRPVSMMAATTAAVGQIISAMNGDDVGTVKAGIPALDRIIPGFYPGELTLIGGRPSMGKSAVALCIALNVARQGKGVAIASLEMTPEAMAMRALSEATAHAGNAVPYTNMRRGEITDRQEATIKAEMRSVADLPIMFLPRAYADVGALLSGAKQASRSLHDFSLLVVDYAQLLRADGKSRYDQITEISMALKGLAVSLNIPVIALSQLSRQVENRDDKRPVMADLRESGQLEQDADNVLFCYRPEYYLERKKPDGGDADEMDEWQDLMDKHRHALEIIVAKQRMGQIGTAHVKFAPAMNRIWE